jgi:DNA repair exonuclease SbcCD ATPase subunit
MKILRMRIVAFKSLLNTSVDFTKFRGLVGIEGRNGAAKSAAFLDCPAWVLYGKPVQEIEAVDDVCNNETGIADAELDIELASGKVITVARRRKGSEATLSISGMGTGTSSGKQEALEKMLGTSYDLWTRTVAFGGSMSAFCTLKDSQKKEALEKLLDLDRFSRAREAASDKVKALKLKLGSAQDRLDHAQGILDSSTSLLDQLQSDHDTYEKKTAKQLNEATTELAQLREESIEKHAQLSELGQQVLDEQKAYEDAYEAWSKKIAALDTEIERVREIEGTHKSAVAVAQDRLVTERKKLRSLLDKDHADECPTCGQVWPKNKSNDILIEDKRKTVDLLEQELETVKHDADAATDKVAKIVQKKKLLNNDQPIPGTLSREYQQLEREIKLEIEPTIRTKEGFVAQLKERMKENPYKLQIQGAKDRLAEAQTDAKENGELVEKHQKFVKYYEFWLEGFGKQGIPSYLIDNSIPFLNEAVGRMANALSDGMMNIHFDPSLEGGREARGGQRLGIVVTNREGGQTYKTQSKGEKARVDVCVLLAIRQLMAQRMAYTFDQLFIDEVFDGLDADGVERVAGLLRSEFPNMPIFVITHNDSLKGLMESTITVRKRNGVSTIKKDAA